MKKSAAPIISVIFILLSACASSLRNDVVSFHEGKLPRGATIRIEPMDIAKQRSLEFSHYKSLIGERLNQLGYQVVDNDEVSELVARIDYSISEGQTQIRSSSPNYVRYHFNYGRYYHPFYYGFYDTWPPEQYSYTVYNRQLTMNISPEGPEADLLFEGRVQSIGKEKEIATVMPYMITAMFNNFPGENAVTKVVTIDKQ